MGIKDFFGKLFNTAKVNISSINKLETYIYGLKNDLSSTKVISEPSYEIEKCYLDSVKSYENGNKNNKLPSIISSYKAYVQEIDSHNRTIEALENKISKPLIEIRKMQDSVLKYDDSFFVKNASLISEINKYINKYGKSKEFLDAIESYKIKKEKILSDFDSKIKQKNKELESTVIVDNFSDDMSQVFSEMYSNNYLIYRPYMDDFSSTVDMIDKHNKNIKVLIEKIKNISFNYENYIKNPSAQKSKIEDLNRIIDDIEVYSNITGEIGESYELMKRFILNYNLICEQYELHQQLVSLLTFVDDYYDSNERKRINESIEVIRNKLQDSELVFYDFKSDDEINELIDKHNSEYVDNHINDSLFDDINGRKLDFEQRSSVLHDSISNLTIAGAGAGKTLTICGKVKYLLEKGIKEDEILLLSYSENSAKDLADKVGRISNNLKVKTFHALGLEILRESTKEKKTVESQFNHIIEDYFSKELSKNSEMLKKIITYYGLYLSNDEFNKKYKTSGDLFLDLKKSDFITLKDQMSLSNDGVHLETIKKELVKSYEELAIANYYFLNGINYTYESTYKEAKTSSYDYRQYTPDFYLNDYKIYHEHYGIDKNGRASQYEEQEEAKYLEGIRWKRNLHQQNNTICLETYSYEFSDGTIFDKLEQDLKANNVVFKPLNNKQISDAINSIYQGQAFKSFITLIRTFISLYKAQYEDEFGFDLLKTKQLNNKYETIRAGLFLDICKDIYCYYINYLKLEDKIDFDDMILKSMRQIKSMDGFKYKYIIVDEFQDISYSRMKFLQELINHGNSKLFAVGDDWQAIYRFSGCDLNIFLNFKDYFNDVTYNYITSTHRNSQELQDIAGPFVMKNPEQYKKNIKSDLRLSNPVRLMYFDDDKYNALMNVLYEINKMKRNASVLLLGRNNKDIETFLIQGMYFTDKKTGAMKNENFPYMNIRFKTAHASKGLEDEFVVIINADDSKLGFPNKIEDDVLLNLVLASRNGFLYAEERRLWYVALTRTKSYTYILVNRNQPSEFVQEIVNKCTVLNPTFIEEINNSILCPKCKSGKLVIRNNPRNNNQFYGCTNYPYCKYTNDDIRAVKKGKRCPYCNDFLVYKKGPYGSFWGCSSYSKTGCSYKEEYIPQKNNYR